MIYSILYVQLFVHDSLHSTGSHGPPLVVCMRPVHNVLVHLGPEESWVRVFLHKAVDLGLDLVEAGWGRILQTLPGPLSGTAVNVHLPERGSSII